MQKYSALTLLGASVNAALGPAIVTTWPKLATAATVTTTEVTATDLVKLAFNQQATATLTGTVGITRGYRSDYYVAPTQTLTAAVANASGAKDGTPAAVATQSAGRTWYPTSTTLLGLMKDTSLAADTAPDTAVNGATFAVCKLLTIMWKCTGIMTLTAGASNDSVLVVAMKARIATKISVTTQAGLTATGDVTTTGSEKYQLAFFSWNTDFFMAAMYQAQQPATAVTDGSAWCSSMDAKMLKDGTAVTLDIAYGFTGRTKCSWQVTAEDGSVGHTFTVTKADSLTSNMLWSEYYGSGGLGTNAQLPTATAADFYVGAYATMTNGGLWLNPATAVAQTTAAAYTTVPTAYPNVNVYQPAVRVTDWTTYTAGTIGTLNYFPGAAGDQKESQTVTMDQMQLSAMYGMYNSQVSTFNSANSSYETLRKTYDDALTAENARLADALKAAFDPMIAVPTRPCSPTRPGDYSGAYLDLKSTTPYGTTYATMVGRANIKSYISSGNALNNLANANASFKQGLMYLVGTSTTLGTSVGHVFGRLGQGDATMSTGSSPFLWMTAVTATKAGMLLGFYPTADADTGMVAATNVVTIDFKAKTWASLDDFKKPDRPGAPTEPMGTGASMLALGATSALVLATLA